MDFSEIISANLSKLLLYHLYANEPRTRFGLKMIESLRSVSIHQLKGCFLRCRKKEGGNKINYIKGNYKNAIDVINKILRTGRVLALEGGCISEYNVGGSCNEKHTMVISGVKKVCTQENHFIYV